MRIFTLHRDDGLEWPIAPANYLTEAYTDLWNVEKQVCARLLG